MMRDPAVSVIAAEDCILPTGGRVLIAGNPGVGCTQFVFELARNLDRRHHVVLMLAGHPGDRARYRSVLPRGEIFRHTVWSLLDMELLSAYVKLYASAGYKVLWIIDDVSQLFMLRQFSMYPQYSATGMMEKVIPDLEKEVQSFFDLGSPEIWTTVTLLMTYQLTYAPLNATGFTLVAQHGAKVNPDRLQDWEIYWPCSLHEMQYRPNNSQNLLWISSAACFEVTL